MQKDNIPLCHTPSASYRSIPYLNIQESKYNYILPGHPIPFPPTYLPVPAPSSPHRNVSHKCKLSPSLSNRKFPKKYPASAPFHILSKTVGNSVLPLPFSPAHPKFPLASYKDFSYIHKSETVPPSPNP